MRDSFRSNVWAVVYFQNLEQLGKVSEIWIYWHSFLGWVGAVQNVTHAHWPIKDEKFQVFRKFCAGQ